MQVHRAFGAVASGSRRPIRLAFVGHGQRRFAAAFRDELGLTAPVFVDVEGGAYRALGMRRGLSATLGSLAVLRHARRARRAGFRQRGIQGDPLQLGGTLVVAPGGIVRWRHLSQVAGDHPPIASILAAAGLVRVPEKPP